MKGSANGTNICFVSKSSFPMVPLPHDRKNKVNNKKYSCSIICQLNDIHRMNDIMTPNKEHLQEKCLCFC